MAVRKMDSLPFAFMQKAFRKDGVVDGIGYTLHRYFGAPLIVSVTNEVGSGSCAHIVSFQHIDGDDIKGTALLAIFNIYAPLRPAIEIVLWRIGDGLGIGAYLQG